MDGAVELWKIGLGGIFGAITALITGHFQAKLARKRMAKTGPINKQDPHEQRPECIEFKKTMQNKIERLVDFQMDSLKDDEFFKINIDICKCEIAKAIINHEKFSSKTFTKIELIENKLNEINTNVAVLLERSKHNEK
jgi:gas vesicle protein